MKKKINKIIKKINLSKLIKNKLFKCKKNQKKKH